MSQPQRLFSSIEQYYRFHSRIYDATRWSFLFGRNAIMQHVAATTAPTNILEIGCGTGTNIVGLARTFPQAAITGLDISEAMLQVARENLRSLASRVTLLHQAYDRPLQFSLPFDLILFSYALTMFNPGWEQAIEYAHSDLAPGGRIAVVDFHNSPFPSFKEWMGVNHVRMDGHLLPLLESCFCPRTVVVRPAYTGLWTYLLFIGEKAP